jgi:hypothetical protein
MAAAVLHNIRKRMGIEDEDEADEREEEDEEAGAVAGDAPMAMRQHYVATYFT